jgi:hypothetical protein
VLALVESLQGIHRPEGRTVPGGFVGRPAAGAFLTGLAG